MEITESQYLQSKDEEDNTELYLKAQESTFTTLINLDEVQLKLSPKTSQTDLVYSLQQDLGAFSFILWSHMKNTKLSEFQIVS